MNKKVSELTEATQINDDDILMIIQNGENKQGAVNKLLPRKRATVTLESTVNANTNYTIPLYYQVGNNSLEVYYLGSKLEKGTDYNEVGTAGEVSNTIQFLDSVGDLDMSDVDGFEDFEETLEFVVRGEYSNDT